MDDIRRTKLIRFLQYFPKSMNSDFRKFLRSPMFNSNDHLIHAYDIIYRHVISRSEANVREAELFAMIYGDSEVFDVERFRNLRAQLLKKAKEFISVNYSISSKERRYCSYVHGLIELRYVSEAKTEIDRFLGKERGNGFDPDLFLESRFQIHKIEASINNRNNLRTWNSSLEKAITYLDLRYLIQKLELECANRTQTLALQSPANPSVIELWPEELECALDLSAKYDIPYLSFLVRVFNLFGNDFTYRELGSLFSEIENSSNNLSPEQFGTLLQLLLNFCAAKINVGSQEYLQLYHETNLALFKSGWYVRSGGISPWNFKNLVTSACKLKQIEWANSFLEKYSALLPESNKEVVLKLSKAIISFSKKDFKSAISYLDMVKDIKQVDVFWAIDTRILGLMAYFEDGDERLISMVDAVRVFLDRSKTNKGVSPTYLEKNKEFVRLLNRFLSIGKFRKAKLEKLKGDLDSKSDLPNIEWLRNKVSEMLK